MRAYVKRPNRIGKAAKSQKTWREKYPDKWKEYRREWGARPENLARKRVYGRVRRAHLLATDPDKYKRQHRNFKLKAKYGITADQWDILFAAQERCCAICKSPTAQWKRGYWHTDHHHITNKVRGILCNECNIGLGKFKDSYVMLQSAINYLRK